MQAHRTKKTAARKAEEEQIRAEIEQARARGEEPLDYMLSVMRDVTADITRRDAMAKAATPYRHPQLIGLMVSPPVFLAQAEVDRPNGRSDVRHVFAPDE